MSYDESKFMALIEPLIEKLGGILGPLVEDPMVHESKVMLNVIIIKELGEDSPLGGNTAMCDLLAEFLTLAIFTGVKGRYETDVHVTKLEPFGFKGLTDIFSSVTFRSATSFKMNEFTEQLQSRVLSYVNNELALSTYLKEEKYYDDFRLFNKLIDGAGGRFINGVKPGRHVDLLCDMLKSHEGYSERVKAIAQEVLAVYDEALPPGFELEQYHSIIGLHTSLPAFNLKNTNAVNRLRTKGFGGKYEPASNYVSLSNFLIDKFVKDGKYFKTSLSRQWEPLLMLPDKAGNQMPIYQPMKLAEYVYGRHSTVNINKAVYKDFEGGKGWENYREEHVRGNIEQALYDTILITLEQNNLLEDTAIIGTNPKVDAEVAVNLGYVRSSMTLMFLMVEQEGTLSTWASFKLRMCIPSQPLKDVEDANVFTGGLLKKVMGKAVDSLDFMPRVTHKAGNQLLHDYEHIFDVELATGRPLFAFKALDTLQGRGESVDVDNIILGRKENGSILTAKRDGNTGVDLSKNLFHFIIAGSRAGKGVMTLNILAGHLASAKPIFYLDRKPDMSALLAAYAGLKGDFPNMFVMNGGQYGIEFDCFDPPGIMNMMADGRRERVFKNIPDYMIASKAWDLELGDMVYMRAVLFCLGLIQLRSWAWKNSPEVYQKLNGDAGITFIFDEFSNWQESFVKQYIHPRGSSSYLNKVLSDKDLEALEDAVIALKPLYEKRASGEELGPADLKTLRSNEKIVNKLSSEEKAYYTDMINNLERSFIQLKTDGNASLKNNEIFRSDVFIIGQNLDASEVPENGTFYTRGANGYNKAPLGVDPFATFFYNFSSDFILGFNTDRRNPNKPGNNYAHQGSTAAKANKILTNTMRGFVYTNLSRNEAIGNGSREHFDSSSTFFKPFLILNNGIEPGNGNLPKTKEELDTLLQQQPEAGFVGQMIAKVGLKNWEKYRVPYLDETETKLRKEVGFMDYMRQLADAGTGLDPQASLGKSKEIADYVVNRMGYDGDIFDFLFDLRPEWTFASVDIVNAFSKPQTYQNQERCAIYNKLFGGGSLSAQLVAAQDTYDAEEASQLHAGDLETLASVDLGGFEDESVQEDAVGQDMPLHGSQGTGVAMQDDFSEHDAEMFNQENFEASKEVMHAVEPNLGIGGYVGDVPISESAMIGAAGVQVASDVSSLRPGRSPYMQGTAPDGASVDMGSITEEFDPDIPLSELDIDNSAYYEEFMNLCDKITRDAIISVGGAPQVRSIEVMGGSLYINNIRYAKRLPGKVLEKFPYDKRMLAIKGLYAELFNFAYLVKFERLTYIKFDSTGFVIDKVANDLMISGSVTPLILFDIIPTKGIVLNGVTYMRDQIDREEGTSIFTSAEKRKELAQDTEDWLVDARSSSWSTTKSLFSRRGFLSKIGGIFSLGVTVAAGTGLASYKVTREGYRGISDMFRTRTAHARTIDDDSSLGL